MTPQCPYCEKPLDETINDGLPIDYLFCHTCKKAWTREAWVDRAWEGATNLISCAQLIELIRKWKEIHKSDDLTLGAYVPKVGA